ncbi:SpoIIE family protein phosphatase [Actinacidiphila sp. bgisy145]|uniref:SpoIIE family protein phosphatase n=1 Tax=Actinacidiphila sp. bgisy145 TaxID=3413792 RepID=UPI003EBDB823
MFLLQVAVILLMAAVAAVLLVVTVEREAEQAAARRSAAIAHAVAYSPGVVAALRSHDPTAQLQPAADAIMRTSHVDFVVVVDRRGIRYTQPDRASLLHTRISYPQDLRALRTGRAVTGHVKSGGHDAMRTFVPIKDSDGRVVGGVAVGVRVSTIDATEAGRLPVLLGITAFAMAASTVGTALLGRRLLRQTRGLGPSEITRLYLHNDAVLHAVREGIVIMDADGTILLANAEARKLLGLPPEAQGQQVDALPLAPPLAELLGSGREASDEVHLAGGRVLVVNQRPLDGHEAVAGSVATMRDSTELSELSSRADAARKRLSVLYGASIGVGSTLDVGRTVGELAKATVPLFADYLTVDLAEPVLNGDEPTGAEPELQRVVSAGIQPDPPFAPVGAHVAVDLATLAAGAPDAGRGRLDADLSAGDGLVPRYVPGFGAADPALTEPVAARGIHSLVTVPLRARGVVLGVAAFWQAQGRAPFEQDDLELAEELAARAAVAIDNARRYTREHAMAVTLQRSLLPGAPPELSALQAAHRYLPAASGGVGGDWFDVIALPGARVALVVGDVVGHGLHAAATMGRLRTAVHNLSALDLAPDELLSLLDDLVTRMDADEGKDTGGEPGVTGATCLYAVYDPSSGLATIARAGHPMPLLVRPDGTVHTPDVPVSPPLGLGGAEPSEATELDLAEGSTLVLYTDGLVERRDRDIDFGLDLLRGTLAAHPGLDPEATCQAVLDAVLPEHPADDVALLVARTRRLPAERIARWEMPSDPAAVAEVRAACGRQLAAWGLEGLGYNTELIVSELATNAVRYGSPPLSVRLLYDRKLICEVADGSSTSPHLLRAAGTDEGGRGLFLVASLAERWGTRYTRRGKVIWTEQPLHTAADEAAAATAEELLDQWGDEEL